MKQGDQQGITEYCSATPGTPTGVQDHGIAGGAGRSGLEKLWQGGWQAQQMDRLHGCRVWDESGPGAEEEGSGLMSRSWLMEPEYESYFMSDPQTLPPTARS